MEGHSFSSIVGLFSSKSFQTSSAIGSEELPVPSDARRQITCCSNSTLLVVGKELRGNSKCWGKDWGGGLQVLRFPLSRHLFKQRGKRILYVQMRREKETGYDDCTCFGNILFNMEFKKAYLAYSD